MTGKRTAHERFPEVLAAAVRVFARDGYRSARMSDVAREAGLSEAALYRYVDSKEGLFVLAIRHALLLEPLPGEDEPDPTTSGASSSARAPGSGSPQPTAAPSPSSSDGSTRGPDDTDYDTPGTVTPRQLTAIWTSLSETYHFGKDERDQARMVCAQVIGRELASSKEISFNEAKAVLDTLAHWHAQALQKDEEPRGYLMLMLRELKEAVGGE